jgi:hypothetical protein
MYGNAINADIAATGYADNTVTNFIIFIIRQGLHYKMSGVTFTDALISTTPSSPIDRYMTTDDNIVLDVTTVNNMWKKTLLGYTTYNINGSNGYEVKDVKFDCCSKCPENSISPVASTSLTACGCNAGYAGTNGGPCVVCAEDTFKAVSGSGNCEACPFASTSVTGSTNKTDCKCPPGFSGADGAACSACVGGKYKAGFGSNSCTACPLNSFSALGSVISSACKCNTGYTGADGDTCDFCAAGTFKTS